MFKHNEQQAEGFQASLKEALDNLAFNDAGLVAAIAQQHDSGEVLMMAWMNREAIEETLATGPCLLLFPLAESYGAKANPPGRCKC